MYLETCTCASDHDKDGCYHCLYAYRQSNKINNISRRCAVELLRKIISGKDSLEPIKGISSIAINSLFDSELEKRFIEAIEQASTSQTKVEITKVPVNGKEGYFLQIGACCWEIELQVPFDDQRGIPVPSQADFVFWPKTKGTKQRPLVVFTDGFLYHKNIVDADSNKRLAIREICGYPVWSLTWKDVQEQLQSTRTVTACDALNTDAMPSGNLFDQTVKRRGKDKLSLKGVSSFDLLIRYLADPEADESFSAQAQAVALAMINQRTSLDQDTFNDWQSGYSVISSLIDEAEVPAFRQALIGKWQPVEALVMLCCLPKSAVKGAKTKDGKTVLLFDETQCRLVVRFDDTATEKDSTFENAWSQYLFSTNVLQFVDEALFITKNGYENNFYNWLALTNTQEDTSDDSEEAEKQSAWEAIIKEELFAPDAISLAQKLKADNCPVPSSTGYELDGEVVAEMVWEEMKIAIQLPDQFDFKDSLESAGWKVLPYDSGEIANALKEV